MSIYTLLWFDVEDYIEPQSDDALKGLLEAFERHGAQGTWKLVGEKARVLERRGRTDVIRLLQRQDIGYHTDFHSRHPVLAEYLEQMGWEDGIGELIRRERPGYEDLVRICGPASTFGQAGGSWAPQLAPLMKALDIPLFMDEAGHIGLDNRPFWYGGVLHVNRLGPRCTRMHFGQGEKGLEEGKRSFDEICQKIGPAGELISIYYHPCEYATRGFWDGANFARGANPPRESWKSAPLRTPEEMREGLDLFSRYLGHIAARPDVEILTGRQLLNLFPDRALQRRFSIEELARMADFPDGRITYRELEDAALAPSELFARVVSALADLHRDERRPDPLSPITPAGPTRRQESTIAAGTAIPVRALLECCADVEEFLRLHTRLPDSVWLGVERISPADFLRTAASLLSTRIDSGQFPETAPLQHGALDLEDHVQGRWGWVIFPEEFDAPNLVELGRLQTWTLKPALMTG